MCYYARNRDGAGKIYVWSKLRDERLKKVGEKGCYKVGLTKNTVEGRKYSQENKSGEKYVTVKK